MIIKHAHQSNAEDDGTDRVQGHHWNDEHIYGNGAVVLLGIASFHYDAINDQINMYFQSGAVVSVEPDPGHPFNIYFNPAIRVEEYHQVRARATISIVGEQPPGHFPELGFGYDSVEVYLRDEQSDEYRARFAASCLVQVTIFGEVYQPS